MTAVAGASQTGRVAHPKRIGGVTKGGVILPGQPGPAQSKVLHRYPREVAPIEHKHAVRLYPSPATPPTNFGGVFFSGPKLADAEVYYKARKPNGIVTWFKTDEAYEGGARHLNDPHTSFVIPLVAYLSQISTIVPYSGRMKAWCSPTAAMPTLRIGYSPVAPTLAPLGELRDAYENLNIEYGYEAFETSEEEALSGGIVGDPFEVFYDVPLIWTPSSVPAAYRMVGAGNYQPPPGTLLLSEYEPAEIAAREKYEKELTPSELAEREVHEKARAKKYALLLLIIEEVGELYKQIEKTVTLEEREKAYSAWRTAADAAEWLEFEVGELGAVGFEPLGTKLQAEHGPWRNGVTKWGYRFKWDKPPAPLPNLMTTPGYFIVEFGGPPGTRWKREGDWTYDEEHPLGFWVEALLGWRFEIEQVTSSTPPLAAGTVAAGAALTGRVHS